MAMAIGPDSGSVWIIGRTQDWPKCFWGGVMKVFGFLPDAILAVIS